MANTVNPALLEHFSTAEQQKEVATFGMWIFLVTEVMLFGGMLTAMTVYRFRFHAAFTQGSSELELWMGAVNTFLLITSSLTMALAVRGAQLNRRMSAVGLMGLTVLLGFTFLAVKGGEYYLHFHDSKVPAFGFQQTGPESAHIELFFVFYFLLTLVHSLHMLIGIGILLVMMVRAWRGDFSEEYTTPIEVSGLYWSFVDVVWVFLFAFLYLPGAHLR